MAYRLFVWTVCLVFIWKATANVIHGREPEPRAIAKHVVHIGIDGVRPDCLKNATGGAQNIFNRLGTEGASTLINARSSIEAYCAPGWTGHLCAMDSTLTGVTSNGWKPPWEGNAVDITPVTGKNQPFPCIFQTIKEQNSTVQTGSFYAWWWLKYLMNQAVPGSIDNEYYCNHYNTPGGYKQCDILLTANSTAYLQQILPSAQSSYTFIYLNHLDNVGHSNGFCGQEYNDQAGEADGQVGQILDAIDASGQKDQTLVLLSSDHSGENTSHGCRKDACLLIPMFLRGPSVKVNYQLQDTVHNIDIPHTVLHALGLQPNSHWQGSVMEEAFQNE